MQWLDDLDDLVFSLVQIAEHVRRPSLEIGFGAACILLLIRLAAMPTEWVPALLLVALGGLVLWALGSAVRAVSVSWLATPDAGLRPGA